MEELQAYIDALKKSEAKQKLLELELSSLFETVKSINANASEEELYQIFRLTLRSIKIVQKMVLFVCNEAQVWEYQASFGTQQRFEGVLLSPALVAEIETGVALQGLPHVAEFDRVITVKHKKETLALVFLSLKQDDIPLLEVQLDFIEALANIIIVAVENKKLARQEIEQKEYQLQLANAHNVQNMLVAKHMPYNYKLQLEASYLPHHQIGGDYYDYIKINEHSFIICIADVSGKGVPAALLMSNFQGGLRILSKQTDDLKTIVRELNSLITQNAKGENFITAFFLTYNFATHTLSYINAGHNPPFLFYDGKTERLLDGTTVLGCFDELPMLDEVKIENLRKFMLFCFTDGFTETTDESGELFGEEFLERFLLENMHHDLRELHKKLMSQLNAYKGKLSYVDDITLLSCKLNLPPAS